VVHEGRQLLWLAPTEHPQPTTEYHARPGVAAIPAGSTNLTAFLAAGDDFGKRRQATCAAWGWLQPGRQRHAQRAVV
jgi:hypothetical protein